MSRRPHTPPPWKAVPRGDGWHIVAEAPYTFVATAHGMKGDDARLIAAAPELLSALVELRRDWLQISSSGDGCAMGKRVLAAILKATGGAP